MSGRAPTPRSSHDLRARLRDSALLEGQTPLILVDGNRTVVLVNVAARALFGISEAEVGLPLQDLQIFRPLELRSLLDQCYAQRQPVAERALEWEPSPGRKQFFDVLVTPLFDVPIASDRALIGASITYTEITHDRRLQDELEHSTRELETAYEELQSTNEELQSTLEELETTNEELQSTNDELQSVNDQLQSRGDQLDEANVYLESILSGLGRGVIVVDRELVVRMWNRGADDLWGLRSDEVAGRHFPNLDIGLPVDLLLPKIRDCLESGEERKISVPARNRRGRDFECAVTMTLLGDGAKPLGVIVVMEDGNPPA